MAIQVDSSSPLMDHYSTGITGRESIELQSMELHSLELHSSSEHNSSSIDHHNSYSEYHCSSSIIASFGHIGPGI